MQLLRACVILVALLGQPWQDAKQALRDLERMETMANIARWQGSTGSWTLAGNWDTGVYPGTTFAETDVGIFDGLSQVSPSSDLDLSGDNRIERIITEPSFTGDIGASGNPLQTDTTPTTATSRIIHRGSGQFFFAGTTGQTSSVVCDSIRTKDALVCSGDMGAAFCKQGHLHITSTSALASWALVDGPAARMTIDAGAQSPDRIIVLSGILENKRAAVSGDVIIVMGGKMIQTGLLPDGVFVYIGPHGRMNYNPNVDATGETPNVVVAGLIDSSDSSQDVEFDLFIRGTESQIVGSISQQVDAYGASLNVDLRQKHP